MLNKLIHVNSFEYEKLSRYFFLSNVIFIYSQMVIKSLCFSHTHFDKTIESKFFFFIVEKKILQFDWMHQNLVQRNSFVIRCLFKWNDEFLNRGLASCLTLRLPIRQDFTFFQLILRELNFVGTYFPGIHFCGSRIQYLCFSHNFRSWHPHFAKIISFI